MVRAKGKKEIDKKKTKKRKKGMRTKIILVPDDERFSENEGDENEGGIFLEKEDIQLIPNNHNIVRVFLCQF